MYRIVIHTRQICQYYCSKLHKFLGNGPLLKHTGISTILAPFVFSIATITEQNPNQLKANIHPF